MQEKEIREELASIRGIMEKSVRFRAISGVAGILAGIYALAGGVMAHLYLYGYESDVVWTNTFAGMPGARSILVSLASLVLLLALVSGIILTMVQAGRDSVSVSSLAVRQLLEAMLFPLLSGGILILILLAKGEHEMIASLCLLFYGLSLLWAGKYSISDIRWLGAAHLLLGWIAALLPAYAFILWLCGFGVLHILYGIIIYRKYNRHK